MWLHEELRTVNESYFNITGSGYGTNSLEWHAAACTLLLVAMS